jgi:toxin ParE1/3/4
MPEVVLDRAAKADLIEIWQYIAQDNPQAADRMLDRISDGFHLLAKFPHGGTARPELGQNLRCYSVGSYVIYFRPAKEGVEIARVLHGARDVDTILGND